VPPSFFQFAYALLFFFRDAPPIFLKPFYPLDLPLLLERGDFALLKRTTASNSFQRLANNLSPSLPRMRGSLAFPFRLAEWEPPHLIKVTRLHTLISTLLFFPFFTALTFTLVCSPSFSTVPGAPLKALGKGVKGVPLL